LKEDELELGEGNEEERREVVDEAGGADGGIEEREWIQAR
jgi:hypothetical protein